MCGINGKVSLGRLNKLLDIDSVFDINKAMKVQSHRGPDDAGFCGVLGERIYEGNSIKNLIATEQRFESLFAFNRLSIRDLSTRGHQPMISNDRKKILLFNGEIYNDVDLRKSLYNMDKNITFNSHSDTETVLLLYEQLGFDEMIKKLNGMFSIVLLDLNLQKLFMGRDRFGIKPLYYSIQNECLYFSSEIKALIQYHDLKKELDTDLFYLNILIPMLGEKILLKNINAVEPGEYLTVNIKAESNFISRHKFYDIDQYRSKTRYFSSDEEAINEYTHILRNAVQRQMVSDVNVGCQISGGIDSSLIARFMSEKKGGNVINGFSIIDPFQNDDEEYINQVINKTCVNVLKFESRPEYFVDNYEDIVWFSDLPIHRAYASEYYKISAEAKKNNCTVLLSGEGADETAGGYNRIAIGIFQPFISSLDIHNKNVKSYKTYAEYAVLNQSSCDEGISILPKGYDLKSHIKEYTDIFDSYQGTDFDKYLKYEITHELRDLLARQDRMMMANSIENRVPFLDNSVVDFVSELPNDMLVRFSEKSPLSMTSDIFTWLQGKYILKALAEKNFGRKFAYRKKTRMAFNEKKIFASQKFVYIYKNRIYPGIKDRGLINVDFVNGLFDNLSRNTVRQTALMERIMHMEMWCQLFIDGKRKSN